MAKDKSILLNDDGTLQVKIIRDVDGLIVSGLVVGDVTKQNQQGIIWAEKGEIKEAPLLGVGVASYLDDDNPSELLREVRVNLREDGQKVTACSFDSDGKLIVIGGYAS